MQHRIARRGRIDLGGMRTSPTVEVSTDSNDRYDMTFYRGSAVVGQIAWGFEGGMGMHTVQREVPASAIDGGYDSVVVRPLYGDSSYSIGHLKLLP